MKIEILNLTGKDINVITDGGTIVLKRHKVVARANIKRSPAFLTNTSIEVVYADTAEILNLPEPYEVEGLKRFYLVSQVVAAFLDRDDILVPDQVVRDNVGKILGCKTLAIPFRKND